MTGVIEIAAAFSGRLPVAQEWALALAGVLSILLIQLIGAYAIVFGVILIILAIKFRTAVTA